MMTLDEAIKSAEEVVEEHTKYNIYGGFESCDECAEEHRQLAEWLKDYKRLKEQEPCDVFDEYGNYKYPSDVELTEPNTATSMPCEYAIDRAEAIKIASGYCHPANVAKELAKLPPVTPQTKTGHWIRVTDKTGHLVWECDKCGWQQRFNTNFCPDCGSHNEGD